MPTGNNDQLPLDVVSFRQLYCSGYTILAGTVHLATTRVGHRCKSEATFGQFKSRGTDIRAETSLDTGARQQDGRQQAQ